MTGALVMRLTLTMLGTGSGPTRRGRGRQIPTGGDWLRGDPDVLAGEPAGRHRDAGGDHDPEHRKPDPGRLRRQGRARRALRGDAHAEQR